MWERQAWGVALMDRRQIRAIGAKKKLPLSTGRNPDDPTPEEIKAMCEKIRASWCSTTERSRRAPERPVDLGTLHSLSSEVGNDE